MKVDGITLLTMIRDGKIKKGTKIRCSDFIEPYFFDGETLCIKSSDYNLSLKDMLENLSYTTYEIIEEKPKKIEKIKIENSHMIDYDEDGKHFIKTNRKDRNIYITKINEIIDNLNYLLEKSDSE